MKTKIIKSVLLSVIALFIEISPCLANTYYCNNSTSSTDWNAAQNINTPCTPATAMTNAAAGDLVYFRGGTYDPGDAADYSHPAMYPDNSGTAGSPITLEVYPDETATLIGNDKGPTFGANGRDWIVWDGFTASVVAFVPQGVQRAATFVDSDHCTIKNCDITGLAQTWGANNMCIGSYSTNYLIIENNNLHDSYRVGETDRNSCAIMMYSTTNATIRNNDIDNCDTGIFDKSHGWDNSFYYNHIIDCRLGITVGNAGSPLGAYDQKAYQNILRDCVEGIGITGSGSSTTDNFQVYNNAIVNNGGASGTTRGITFNADGRDAIVYNNIIYDYAYAVRYYSGVSEVSYSDRNDFYSVDYWNIDSYEGTDYSTLAAWQAATSFDGNSVITNPNFVDVNGTDPEDYKLQAGSLALTLGVDRQDYDDDGNTTEVIPAGAYITGSETIGYSANGNGGGSSAGSVISGGTLSGCTF